MQINGKIASTFWKGLFTLLPLYLTLYFLYWLITSIEATFSTALKNIIGTFYLPGMGLLTALLFIFITGLLFQTYATQHLNDSLNRLIAKLPVIGEIYGYIQSIVKYLTSSAKPEGQNVVMVHFDALDISILGIVIRNDFSDAPQGLGGDETMISVYLPMSYQIGGYTVLVPKDRATPVALSPNEALKWAFTGGIQK